MTRTSRRQPTQQIPLSVSGIVSERATRLADICRPQKYLATYYVHPDGTGTHTTIAAAITAAASAQGVSGTVATAAAMGYASGGGVHPDRVVRIVVGGPPGTIYNEQVAPVPWCHLVAANPGIAITSATIKGALGNGGYLFVEGLIIHGTGPWYAYHYGAAGFSVHYNCRFISDTPNGQILGMDGYAGTLGLFLGCTFESTTSASRMNIHGALANTQPLTIGFVDCTHPVGIDYSDLASGMADRVIVLGGRMGSVALTGANVVGILDPDAVSGPHSLTSGAKIQYGKIVPPLAPGFLRQVDRDYYYPMGASADNLEVAVKADVTAGNPTADRTYYVPIRVNHYRRATNLVAAIASAAGNANVGLAESDATGKPGVMFDRNSGAVTVAAGRQAFPFQYPAHLFPGDGIVWAAIQFTNAGALVAMSTLLSTLTPVWYQDGTMPARGAACTPVTLAAGTAAPIGLVT